MSLLRERIRPGLGIIEPCKAKLALRLNEASFKSNGRIGDPPLPAALVGRKEMPHGLQQPQSLRPQPISGTRSFVEQFECLKWDEVRRIAA